MLVLMKFVHSTMRTLTPWGTLHKEATILVQRIPTMLQIW